MHRPIRVLEGKDLLDEEFRKARETHHKLLAIEDTHQKLLDAVCEECAPGLVRVGRILSRLARRSRRAERSSEGSWKPRQRPTLVEALKKRKTELLKLRNVDPRWKEALRWLDTAEEGAPSRGKARRRADESEEDFKVRVEKRAASGRDVQNRREVRRTVLYQKREIHYSTWNFLLKQVDQAKQAVVTARKEGLPADWKHPRWDDTNTIEAVFGSGFRVIEEGPLWWVLEVKLFEGAVRFKAKFGNWHEIPSSAKLKTCQITRRKRGNGWEYSASITVDGMPDRAERFASRGLVSLDWGHREHGHENAKEGLRVFTWLGDDGESGEILLPIKCRELLDLRDATKSRLDKAYDARKQPEKNRHLYRKRLMLSGVRTEEESLWLKWETRYEARLTSLSRKIRNIRKNTYYRAIQTLRNRYSFFAVEDESNASLKKKAIEEMSPRRMRQNRDLSARYEFIQMIERYGGKKIPVSARNTTRECPYCGHLSENTPELLIACEGCGKVRDKDKGAAEVILRRAKAVLEKADQSL